MRDLGAHQDPDLVEPLPLAIQLEERPDLEVAGRDVEALRDLRPVVQVPDPVQPDTLLSTMKSSPPRPAELKAPNVPILGKRSYPGVPMESFKDAC